MSARSEPDSARARRPVSRGALLFFVVFLAAQLVIPLVQATRAGPARFGWQMFARLPIGAHGEVFVVERAEGVVETVRISDHVARGRPEIDYPAVFPAHVCQVTPGALAVRFEQAGTVRERYTCP